MISVHLMKERLASELSETCEAWHGEDLCEVKLCLLQKLAACYNEIHEACRNMYHAKIHTEKHIHEHYPN